MRTQRSLGTLRMSIKADRMRGMTANSALPGKGSTDSGSFGMGHLPDIQPDSRQETELACSSSSGPCRTRYGENLKMLR